MNESDRWVKAGTPGCWEMAMDFIRFHRDMLRFSIFMRFMGLGHDLATALTTESRFVTMHMIYGTLYGDHRITSCGDDRGACTAKHHGAVDLSDLKRDRPKLRE